MIRVKDGGTHVLHLSPTETRNVSQGFIKPMFREKGVIGYEIRFIEFGPEQIITAAVEAVAADPENGIAAVEAVPAVTMIPEMYWGFFVFPDFACNHEESNVLLKCHEKAIEVLGENWEIFDLDIV